VYCSDGNDALSLNVSNFNTVNTLAAALTLLSMSHNVLLHKTMGVKNVSMHFAIILLIDLKH